MGNGHPDTVTLSGLLLMVLVASAVGQSTTAASTTAEATVTTTGAPATGAPTTAAPTTGAPTTAKPTTGAQTTVAPTTGTQATAAPTTGSQTVTGSTVPPATATAGPTVTGSSVPPTTATAGPTVTGSTVPPVTATAGSTVTGSTVPPVTATAGSTVTGSTVPPVTATAGSTVTGSSVPPATATAGPTVTATSMPPATATAGSTVTGSTVPPATATAGPTVTATSMPGENVTNQCPTNSGMTCNESYCRTDDGCESNQKCCEIEPGCFLCITMTMESTTGTQAWSTPTTVQPAACDYEGQRYRHGEEFPSNDECNTCYCSGGSVSCTEKACVPTVCQKDIFNACFVQLFEVSFFLSASKDRHWMCKARSSLEHCVSENLKNCREHLGHVAVSVLEPYPAILRTMSNMLCTVDMQKDPSRVIGMAGQCLVDFAEVALTGSVPNICRQLKVTKKCLVEATQSCSSSQKNVFSMISSTLDMTQRTVCVPGSCNLLVAEKCIKDAYAINAAPLYREKGSVVYCSWLKTSLTCAATHTASCSKYFDRLEAEEGKESGEEKSQMSKEEKRSSSEESGDSMSSSFVEMPDLKGWQYASKLFKHDMSSESSSSGSMSGDMAVRHYMSGLKLVFEELDREHKNDDDSKTESDSDDDSESDSMASDSKDDSGSESKSSDSDHGSESDSKDRDMSSKGEGLKDILRKSENSIRWLVGVLHHMDNGNKQSGEDEKEDEDGEMDDERNDNEQTMADGNEKDNNGTDNGTEAMTAEGNDKEGNATDDRDEQDGDEEMNARLHFILEQFRQETHYLMEEVEDAEKNENAQASFSIIFSLRKKFHALLKEHMMDVKDATLRGTVEAYENYFNGEMYSASYAFYARLEGVRYNLMVLHGRATHFCMEDKRQNYDESEQPSREMDTESNHKDNDNKKQSSEEDEEERFDMKEDDDKKETGDGRMATGDKRRLDDSTRSQLIVLGTLLNNPYTDKEPLCRMMWTFDERVKSYKSRKGAEKDDSKGSDDPKGPGEKGSDAPEEQEREKEMPNSKDEGDEMNKKEDAKPDTEISESDEMEPDMKEEDEEDEERERMAEAEVAASFTYAELVVGDLCQPEVKWEPEKDCVQATTESTQPLVCSLPDAENCIDLDGVVTMMTQAAVERNIKPVCEYAIEALTCFKGSTAGCAVDPESPDEILTLPDQLKDLLQHQCDLDTPSTPACKPEPRCDTKAAMEDCFGKPASQYIQICPHTENEVLKCIRERTGSCKSARMLHLQMQIHEFLGQFPVDDFKDCPELLTIDIIPEDALKPVSVCALKMHDALQAHMETSPSFNIAYCGATDVYMNCTKDIHIPFLMQYRQDHHEKFYSEFYQKNCMMGDEMEPQPLPDFSGCNTEEASSSVLSLWSEYMGLTDVHFMSEEYKTSCQRSYRDERLSSFQDMLSGPWSESCSESAQAFYAGAVPYFEEVVVEFCPFEPPEPASNCSLTAAQKCFWEFGNYAGLAGPHINLCPKYEGSLRCARQYIGGCDNETMVKMHEELEFMKNRYSNLNCDVSAWCFVKSADNETEQTTDEEGEQMEQTTDEEGDQVEQSTDEGGEPAGSWVDSGAFCTEEKQCDNSWQMCLSTPEEMCKDELMQAWVGDCIYNTTMGCSPGSAAIVEHKVKIYSQMTVANQNCSILPRQWSAPTETNFTEELGAFMHVRLTPYTLCQGVGSMALAMWDATAAEGMALGIESGLLNGQMALLNNYYDDWCPQTDEYVWEEDDNTMETTTEGSRGTTTEGRRDTTTDSSRSSTTDRNSETTTDSNRETTTDSNRETTTDSNRETTTDSNRETTTDSNRDTTTDSNRDTTTDSSGSSTTDISISSTTVSSRETTTVNSTQTRTENTTEMCGDLMAAEGNLKKIAVMVLYQPLEAQSSKRESCELGAHLFEEAKRHLQGCEGKDAARLHAVAELLEGLIDTLAFCSDEATPRECNYKHAMSCVADLAESFLNLRKGHVTAGLCSKQLGVEMCVGYSMYGCPGSVRHMVERSFTAVMGAVKDVCNPPVVAKPSMRCEPIRAEWEVQTPHKCDLDGAAACMFQLHSDLMCERPDWKNVCLKIPFVRSCVERRLYGCPKGDVEVIEKMQAMLLRRTEGHCEELQCKVCDAQRCLNKLAKMDPDQEGYCKTAMAVHKCVETSTQSCSRKHAGHLWDKLAFVTTRIEAYCWHKVDTCFAHFSDAAWSLMLYSGPMFGKEEADREGDEDGAKPAAGNSTQPPPETMSDEQPDKVEEKGSMDKPTGGSRASNYNSEKSGSDPSSKKSDGMSESLRGDSYGKDEMIMDETTDYACEMFSFEDEPWWNDDDEMNFEMDGDSDDSRSSATSWEEDDDSRSSSKKHINGSGGKHGEEGSHGSVGKDAKKISHGSRDDEKSSRGSGSQDGEKSSRGSGSHDGEQSSRGSISDDGKKGSRGYDGNGGKKGHSRCSRKRPVPLHKDLHELCRTLFASWNCLERRVFMIDVNVQNPVKMATHTVLQLAKQKCKVMPLQCYHCKKAGSHGECDIVPETCTADKQACHTLVKGGENGYVSKGCVSPDVCLTLNNCTDDKCEECCTGHLCNKGVDRPMMGNDTEEVPVTVPPTPDPNWQCPRPGPVNPKCELDCRPAEETPCEDPNQRCCEISDGCTKCVDMTPPADLKTPPCSVFLEMHCSLNLASNLARQQHPNCRVLQETVACMTNISTECKDTYQAQIVHTSVSNLKKTRAWDLCQRRERDCDCGGYPLVSFQGISNPYTDNQTLCRHFAAVETSIHYSDWWQCTKDDRTYAQEGLAFSRYYLGNTCVAPEEKPEEKPDNTTEPDANWQCPTPGPVDPTCEDACRPAGEPCNDDNPSQICCEVSEGCNKCMGPTTSAVTEELTVPEVPEFECGKDVPVPGCVAAPCDAATCNNSPNAICSNVYCGGCLAVFYQDGHDVSAFCDIEFHPEKPGLDMRCYDPANDVGYCSLEQPYWYYDFNLGKCDNFTYTGCGGGLNRFYSEEECNSVCGSEYGVPSKYTCPPVEQGEVGHCGELCSEEQPCDGDQMCCSNGCGHDCVDQVKGSAEPEFECGENVPVPMCIPETPCETAKCPMYPDAECKNVYCGGCLAVFYLGDRDVTPFCQERDYTEKPDARCYEDKEEGYCQLDQPSWSYNSKMGECEYFTYTGCGGNANRFYSEKDCYYVCRSDGDCEEAEMMFWRHMEKFEGRLKHLPKRAACTIFFTQIQPEGEKYLKGCKKEDRRKNIWQQLSAIAGLDTTTCAMELGLGVWTDKEPQLSCPAVADIETECPSIRTFKSCEDAQESFDCVNNMTKGCLPGMPKLEYRSLLSYRAKLELKKLSCSLNLPEYQQSEVYHCVDTLLNRFLHGLSNKWLPQGDTSTICQSFSGFRSCLYGIPKLGYKHQVSKLFKIVSFMEKKICDDAVQVVKEAGIECFSCEEAMNNEECNKMTEKCVVTQQSCGVTAQLVQNNTFISKGCKNHKVMENKPACKHGKDGTIICTSYCQGNLCNEEMTMDTEAAEEGQEVTMEEEDTTGDAFVLEDFTTCPEFVLGVEGYFGGVLSSAVMSRQGNEDRCSDASSGLISESTAECSGTEVLERKAELTEVLVYVSDMMCEQPTVFFTESENTTENSTNDMTINGTSNSTGNEMGDRPEDDIMVEVCAPKKAMSVLSEFGLSLSTCVKSKELKRSVCKSRKRVIDSIHTLVSRCPEMVTQQVLMEAETIGNLAEKVCTAEPEEHEPKEPEEPKKPMHTFPLSTCLHVDYKGGKKRHCNPWKAVTCQKSLEHEVFSVLGSDTRFCSVMRDSVKCFIDNTNGCGDTMDLINPKFRSLLQQFEGRCENMWCPAMDEEEDMEQCNVKAAHVCVDKLRASVTIGDEGACRMVSSVQACIKKSTVQCHGKKVLMVRKLEGSVKIMSALACLPKPPRDIDVSGCLTNFKIKAGLLVKLTMMDIDADVDDDGKEGETAGEPDKETAGGESDDDSDDKAADNDGDKIADDGADDNAADDIDDGNDKDDDAEGEEGDDADDELDPERRKRSAKASPSQGNSASPRMDTAGSHSSRGKKAAGKKSGSGPSARGSSASRNSGSGSWSADSRVGWEPDTRHQETKVKIVDTCAEVRLAYPCVEDVLAAMKPRNRVFASRLATAIWDAVMEVCKPMHCFTCVGLKDNELCNMQETRQCSSEQQMCYSSFDKEKKVYHKGCIRPKSCKEQCRGKEGCHCCHGHKCNLPPPPEVPEICEVHLALECAFSLFAITTDPKTDQVTLSLMKPSLDCVMKNTVGCVASNYHGLYVTCGTIIEMFQNRDCIGQYGNPQCGTASILGLSYLMTDPYKYKPAVCSMFDTSVSVGLSLESDMCSDKELTSYHSSVARAGEQLSGFCTPPELEPRICEVGQAISDCVTEKVWYQEFSDCTDGMYEAFKDCCIGLTVGCTSAQRAPLFPHVQQQVEQWGTDCPQTDQSDLDALRQNIFPDDEISSTTSLVIEFATSISLSLKDSLNPQEDICNSLASLKQKLANESASSTLDHALAGSSTQLMIDDLSNDCKDTTITPEIVTQVCSQKKLDIVIIMDGSGSIAEEEFTQEMAFVSNLINLADLESGAVRTYVLQFAKDVRTIVTPEDSMMVDEDGNEVQNRTFIEEALGDTKQILGDTKTGEAFTEALAMMETNGRPEVPKHFILITDGAATDPSVAKAMADKAKAEGVHIFVVAIRMNTPAQVNEIKSISSTPASQNVIGVEEFTELDAVYSKIFLLLCRLETTSFCNFDEIRSKTTEALINAMTNPFAVMKDKNQICSVVQARWDSIKEMSGTCTPYQKSLIQVTQSMISTLSKSTCLRFDLEEVVPGCNEAAVNFCIKDAAMFLRPANIDDDILCRKLREVRRCFDSYLGTCDDTTFMQAGVKALTTKVLTRCPKEVEELKCWGSTAGAEVEVPETGMPVATSEDGDCGIVVIVTDCTSRVDWLDGFSVFDPCKSIINKVMQVATCLSEEYMQRACPRSGVDELYSVTVEFIQAQIPLCDVPDFEIVIPDDYGVVPVAECAVSGVCDGEAAYQCLDQFQEPVDDCGPEEVYMCINANIKGCSAAEQMGVVLQISTYMTSALSLPANCASKLTTTDSQYTACVKDFYNAFEPDSDESACEAIQQFVECSSNEGISVFQRALIENQIAALQDMIVEYCSKLDDATVADAGETCNEVTTEDAVCISQHFKQAVIGPSLLKPSKKLVCEKVEGKLECAANLDKNCPHNTKHGRLHVTHTLSEVLLNNVCPEKGDVSICSIHSALDCVSSLARTVARHKFSNSNNSAVCKSLEHTENCLRLTLSDCWIEERRPVLTTFSKIQCLALDACPSGKPAPLPEVADPDPCVDLEERPKDAHCNLPKAQGCLRNFNRISRILYAKGRQKCKAYSDTLHCMMDNLHGCSPIQKASVQFPLKTAMKIAKRNKCITELTSTCIEPEDCGVTKAKMCITAFSANLQAFKDKGTVCTQLNAVKACIETSVESCTESARAEVDVEFSQLVSSLNISCTNDFSQCAAEYIHYIKIIIDWKSTIIVEEPVSPASGSSPKSSKSSPKSPKSPKSSPKTPKSKTPDESKASPESTSRRKRSATKSQNTHSKKSKDTKSKKSKDSHSKSGSGSMATAEDLIGFGGDHNLRLVKMCAQFNRAWDCVQESWSSLAIDVQTLVKSSFTTYHTFIMDICKGPKPGYCKLRTQSPGSRVIDDCSEDWECSGVKKCCTMGRSRMCTTPEPHNPSCFSDVVSTSTTMLGMVSSLYTVQDRGVKFCGLFATAQTTVLQETVIENCPDEYFGSLTSVWESCDLVYTSKCLTPPEPEPQCSLQIGEDCLTLYNTAATDKTNNEKCLLYKELELCVLKLYQSCDDGNSTQKTIIDAIAAQVTTVKSALSCIRFPGFECEEPKDGFTVDEGDLEGKTLGIKLSSSPQDFCPTDTCEILITRELIQDRTKMPRCGKSKARIEQIMLGRSCSMTFTAENWNETQYFSVIGRIDNKRDKTFSADLKVMATIVVNGVRTQSTPIKDYKVKVRNREPKKPCQSNNDPHMKTFDGLKYDNMRQGAFSMYQHQSLPFEVQIYTARCNFKRKTPATCNCGVGIRSGDTVFSINRCYPRGDPRIQGPKLWLNRNLNETLNGNSMNSLKITKANRGKKWLIFFRTGTYVQIKLRKTKGKGNRNEPKMDYMNIHIMASSADVGAVTGLCGNANGKKKDDFLCPDGTAVTKGNDLGKCWKVPEGEFNIQGVPADSSIVDVPGFCREEDSQCLCDLRDLSETCDLPFGEDRTSTIPIGNQDLRRKRATGEPNFGMLMDPEDEPQDTVFPTASGITEQEATAVCTEAVTNTDFNERCGGFIQEDENTVAIQNCVSDVKAMDSLVNDFTAQTVDGLREECNAEAAADTNTTLVENILSNSCPSGCSDSGTCNNGTCECNDGFTTEDCSINLAEPPETIRLIEDFCITSGAAGNCQSLTVLGVDFADGAVCHFEILDVNENGSTKNGTQMSVPATVDSFEEVTCDLAGFGPMPLLAVLVSVSNNGAVTSQSEQYLYLAHNPVCMECTVMNLTATCTKQRASCLVDNVCYRPLDVSVNDPCHVCDVYTGELKYMETPNCPALTTTEAPLTNNESRKMNDTAVIGLSAGMAALLLIVIAVVVAIMVYNQRMKRRNANKDDERDLTRRSRSSHSDEAKDNFGEGLQPAFANYGYYGYGPASFVENPAEYFVEGIPKRHSSKRPDPTRIEDGHRRSRDADGTRYISHN